MFTFEGGESVAEKPNSSKTGMRRAASKSGIMPRPILEPEARYEAPGPSAAPAARNDHAAVTGLYPIVAEPEDGTAQRDRDDISGS